ncbi:sugar nucleotide-binding protein [uncultured Planktosalinus sp.]|uniref:sugar nucleotide-binding protein n=1 Tax=uncultured Planktosalinus sp. TaxID=1810935 RepID=UPI0030DCFF88
MTTKRCRLFYISTVKVFDGIRNFPALENDKAFAVSKSGKLALTVEKLLKQLPPQQCTIVRLPLVLGVNAPEITKLKYAIATQDVFEIYPDLVVNVTTDTRISQQLHYLVNQSKYGIFHSGSTDLIHHSDLFEEISEKLGSIRPLFKRVYESNADRFEAVLPKKSYSLEEHKYSVLDVINEVTLNQNIPTLKTTLL